MGGFKVFLQKWFYDIDRPTLFFALGLMFLGLVMSFSVSPAMAKRIHVYSYYFTVRHIIFASVAVFIMLFLSMLSRQTILNLAYAGFIVSLFLLVVVLFAGGSIKGAKRWINLGFFALQPAEIMKPFFIIMNAHFLSLTKFNKIAPMIAVGMLGTVVGLLVLQPDFGSSIIYSTIWLAQVFLGNSRLNILFISVLASGIVLGTIGFLFFPHVHYRIMNFLSLSGGQEQYQTKKSLESIYNGGFFGTGLGEGEVKYQLPDAHTDYIFATICEELGTIFAIALIMFYLLFAYRHLASNAMNKKYDIRIIYGLVLVIVLQSCIHISVNINLIPSKGMTLPFVSYGGSSMLTNAMIFGFLLAFTRKTYSYKSPYNIFENAYIQSKFRYY